MLAMQLECTTRSPFFVVALKTQQTKSWVLQSSKNLDSQPSRLSSNNLPPLKKLSTSSGNPFDKSSLLKVHVILVVSPSNRPTNLLYQKPHLLTTGSVRKSMPASGPAHAKESKIGLLLLSLNLDSVSNNQTLDKITKIC